MKIQTTRDPNEIVMNNRNIRNTPEINPIENQTSCCPGFWKNIFWPIVPSTIGCVLAGIGCYEGANYSNTCSNSSKVAGIALATSAFALTIISFIRLCIIKTTKIDGGQDLSNPIFNAGVGEPYYRTYSLKASYPIGITTLVICFVGACVALILSLIPSNC